MDRRAVLAYARLTLRKNRAMTLALAGVYLASLPFGAWVAADSGHSARTGVEITFGIWCFAGLPLLAVLLGAGAGEGLRAQEARESEALLPLSHLERASGACLAALLQVALLAALVAAGLPFAPTKLGLYQASLLALPYLLGGLLSAFACAYMVGQAVAGAALALILAAPGALFLAVPAWNMLSAGRDRPVAELISLALLVLQLGGPVLALRIVAAWRERGLRHGLARAAAAAALVVAGGAGMAWLPVALRAFR